MKKAGSKKEVNVDHFDPKNAEQSMKCVANGLHSNAVEIATRHTAGAVQGEWCRTKLSLRKDPAEFILLLGEIIQHHLHHFSSLLGAASSENVYLPHFYHFLSILPRYLDVEESRRTWGRNQVHFQILASSRKTMPMKPLPRTRKAPVGQSNEDGDKEATARTGSKACSSILR